MQLDDRTTASACPGTMMDVQLTLGSILEHAVHNHPAREIVARLDDGTTARLTYGQFAKRVARLANALVALGVRPGDRVASFGWNTHRHLELYYAVPMIGAVLHTANIRLFPEQVAWSFAHAEDKFVFYDPSLAALVAKALATPNAPKIGLVALGACEVAMPGEVHDYETLLVAQPETFAFPELDERTAATLCYTSATTGDPKGVAFSHRAQLLHAYAAGQVDALAIGQRDVVLPVVPMFHVNAWGMPFLCPMVGAKLVLPGPKLDATSVISLVEEEGVTISLGVPTVWLAVRDELAKRNARLPTLKRLVIGGSAMPPSLYDDLATRGIHTIHAWGMTEMSPIGTVAQPIAELAAAPPEVLREKLLTQGRFTPLVAWKVLDSNDAEVPHDGTTPGDLWVRGPAVTGSYYKVGSDLPVFREGYFQTGDVCTVDEHGYLRVVDRTKDMIKSGGEWISSVALENLIMGHPAVREAAVIGVPHAKWSERPIAVVALREGASVGEDDLRAWVGERVAKWMIPDRTMFVEAIPRTGVGKFLKRELRERYRDLLAGDPR